MSRRGRDPRASDRRAPTTTLEEAQTNRCTTNCESVRSVLRAGGHVELIGAEQGGRAVLLLKSLNQLWER